MQSKKTSFFRMFMQVLLLGIIVLWMPEQSFAEGNGFVSDCLGKENQEDCLKGNSDVDDEKMPVEESTKIGVFDYIKVLFALAFVIGLLVLVLKFLNRKNMSYQQNSMLRNLGGISVGPQKSVQLLSIGNKLYVVGVGENISLIKEIEDEAEIERLLDLYEQKQQEIVATPFLTELLAKLKPSKNTEVEQTTSFNELFQSKLTSIKKERSKQLESWKEKGKDKDE